jgi:hypothetical protein
MDRPLATILGSRCSVRAGAWLGVTLRVGSCAHLRVGEYSGHASTVVMPDDHRDVVLNGGPHELVEIDGLVVPPPSHGMSDDGWPVPARG